MKRSLAITVALAVLALAMSLLSGEYRFAAVLGSSCSSLAAFAVLSVTGWGLSGSAAHSAQRTLLTIAVSFGLRLVLLAVGLTATFLAGASPVAFAVAFFASYLAFQAVELAYVISAPRMAS